MIGLRHAAPVPRLGDLFGMVASELERPQDPVEDRVEAAREAQRRGDVLAWGRAVTPEKYALPFCKEMHGYFADIRAEEFTCTEAPRDHAKTTIKCHLIPLYMALAEPERFDYFLNVQATAPKALAVNLSIRHEVEYNEVLRALYGDQVGLDKWTDQQFVLRNGVVFHAIGAGQSVRGVNYLNRRPNYVIVDDLYDEEHINSPDLTRKVNQWFWGSLYPSRAESRENSIHVQGTAINDSDLLKELSNKPGVKFRSFASIKPDGSALWPQLMSAAQRRVQRELMPATIFAREYQNERRDDAESIVKSAWLEGWEYDRIPADHEVVGVEVGCDPSIGEKLVNDFTGMALVVKTRAPGSVGALEYWIEDLVEEHLSNDARLARLQRVKDTTKWTISRANVEGIGGFKDFALQAGRKTSLPVRVVDHVRDKLTNLELKSHHFEHRRVHVSRRVPEKLRKELAYQLTTNHPRHDDIRDAVLLCLEDARSGEWGPVI